MNWRVKGIVQKGLSVMPGGIAISNLFAAMPGRYGAVRRSRSLQSQRQENSCVATFRMLRILESQLGQISRAFRYSREQLCFTSIDCVARKSE